MTENDKTLKQIREKLYYLENKEKFCLASKKWRENHKDKVREIERKRHYKRMQNPEYVQKKRARERERYLRNKFTKEMMKDE